MDNREHEVSSGERLELLIGRIADGEADAADWSAFSGLAESEPGAWKRLAGAQREHAAMSLAVGVALHAADRVELPTMEAASAWSRREVPETVGAGGSTALSRVRMYGGWAAAAAVAIAWFGGLGANGLRGQADSRAMAGNQAGILPAGWRIDTPEDAVQAYLDVGGKSGRVIGELPNRVLVDSQPAMLEGGRRGVEVVYVRQFVERAVVTDLARLGLDEAGRPVPVPMTVPTGWTGPE